jgi:hypothetical protein
MAGLIFIEGPALRNDHEIFFNGMLVTEIQVSYIEVQCAVLMSQHLAPILN